MADGAPPPPPASAATVTGREQPRDVAEVADGGLPPGRINPPKPHPRVAAAGIGPLPSIPPEITASPADAWQPPRLRTEQPLSAFKYQYRGGWKLIFDAARLPAALVLGGAAFITAKWALLDLIYGPPDPKILSVYHDWDRKRPGAWPPYKPDNDPSQGQPERSYGIRHVVQA